MKSFYRVIKKELIQKANYASPEQAEKENYNIILIEFILHWYIFSILIRSTNFFLMELGICFICML